MREVWVAGTFDGLHEGHQQLLDDALRVGKLTHVFVNSDTMIEERKGTSLLCDETDRIEMISNFLDTRTQDTIGVFKIHNLHIFKKDLLIRQPILVHGDDYDIKSLSKLYGVDELWWRKHNILPVFTPRQAGVSSTELRTQRGKKD